jgi:short-subunit dehydrogenase
VRAAPRRILVTGASSGLGAGLARSYAAPGVELALIGRDGARLAASVEACRAQGAAAEAVEHDVGAQPFGAWVAEWSARAPVDLALACAGTSAGPEGIGRPEGVMLAARQIASNLLGVVHTIEPLLPEMVARGAGHVAMVSSVAGYRGLPFSPAYSASKAGVRAYGDGLRALLRPAGVAVSVIVPGFFDTPMTDRFMGAKPFMLSLPRTVAIVRRGLDLRRARIVFPRLLALGIQATDVMPAPLGDAILRSQRFHIRPGA